MDPRGQITTKLFKVKGQVFEKVNPLFRYLETTTKGNNVGNIEIQKLEKATHDTLLDFFKSKPIVLYDITVARQTLTYGYVNNVYTQIKKNL